MKAALALQAHWLTDSTIPILCSRFDAVVLHMSCFQADIT